MPPKSDRLLGLKVEKCCRNIQVNAVIYWTSRKLGFKHCWLKTDSKEAGIGPADDGPLPPFPLGIKTKITDHTGQSGECWEQNCIDEACVNLELEIGDYTGRWTSWNNCNTLVEEILTKCKKSEEECCRELRH